LNIKHLIETNNLKPEDVSKSIGVSAGAAAGACLIAVDKYTREPLDPIDDNATKWLRERGQFAVNPADETPVHKVKESATWVEKDLNGVEVERKIGGHWRVNPGEKPRRGSKNKPRNRKGKPGPIHEFMERAVRRYLAHLGYQVAETRGPQYEVCQSKDAHRWHSNRNNSRYFADVLATAGGLSLYFEVVDYSDYLDNKNKRKFITRITGADVFVYRINSNRTAGLRSFDHLVALKDAWELAVQNGDYARADILLIESGARLCVEAQYSSEVPTNSQKERFENEHNNIGPTRFKVHQGGKSQGDSTTNNAKRGKSVAGDEHRSAAKRDDRRT
jgi:hypothetical protein